MRKSRAALADAPVGLLDKLRALLPMRRYSG
jgi:hypothetical protein